MTSSGKRNAAGWLRSPCPVAATLDLIGDKWSLLVVRDLFLGKRTFGEILASPERIPTNILADRLRRLEEHGLIEASVYQERPVRYAYTLTARGRALHEVLDAVVRWGRKCIPGTMNRLQPAPGAAPAARGRSRKK